MVISLKGFFRTSGRILFVAFGLSKNKKNTRHVLLPLFLNLNLEEI